MYKLERVLIYEGLCKCGVSRRSIVRHCLEERTLSRVSKHYFVSKLIIKSSFSRSIRISFSALRAAAASCRL